MAEDLTDDWWEGADKKAEAEEEEEKAKTVEKKKRRKKRKFEEIVDSNVMSSEDQVKAGLSILRFSKNSDKFYVRCVFYSEK